ncbi:hydroxyethylthiazole kinase [Roseibium litorale]|uniref:hydroxyethylthiazole kinase n=1 Tax=Roseibium litorale TaxID=2803841 RepID=A0ABR9CI08_9HYPH|nr:hydroxyethylthiazole kinase [Roseibium litorale]MBD8890465.1 hydroxyethylthiazole kinase [Roseibium litorale]
MAERIFDAASAADVLARLRGQVPRVHCLTNPVAQAFTANVLLALGAVPSMTVSVEEVASFAASADGLLVNLGMLEPERRAAIPLAIAGAKGAGKPVVLDPVFVQRSPARCAMARDLLAGGVSLLKSNKEEMAALFPEGGGRQILDEQQTVLVTTGAEDEVSLAGRGVRLGNGDPLMARVTATGCALGAVLAACLAVEPDHMVAAAAGVSLFNIAAELAVQECRGPGSLVPALLDALYRLRSEDIHTHLIASASGQETDRRTL